MNTGQRPQCSDAVVEEWNYEVVVCRDVSSLNAWVDLVVESTTLICNDCCPCVAVDVEFCSLREGEIGGPIAALMTIANHRMVVCVPFSAFYYIIPKRIMSLLCRDDCCKFFVNPRNDLIALGNLIGGHELMPVNVLSVDVPLGLHMGRLPNSSQRVSLADIASHFFGLHMTKVGPDCARNGRWQDVSFCVDNIAYAATDAIVTFMGACILHSEVHRKRFLDSPRRSGRVELRLRRVRVLGSSDKSSVTAVNAISQRVSGTSLKIDYGDVNGDKFCTVTVANPVSKRVARESACTALLQRLLMSLTGITTDS